MRAWIKTSLFALSASAFAASPTAETIAFGSRVVSVGDPVGHVMEIAGKPDRDIEIQNDKGAAIGERFEYYREGKTILVTITSGRVVKLEELR